MAGAPLGNDNRNKGRVWRAALQRALETRTKSRADGIEALDALAEKLLASADTGDVSALRELGDRLDGKPAQAIIGGEEGDNPVQVAAVVRFVEPAQ